MLFPFFHGFPWSMLLFHTNFFPNVSWIYFTFPDIPDLSLIYVTFPDQMNDTHNTLHSYSCLFHQILWVLILVPDLTSHASLTKSCGFFSFRLSNMHGKNDFTGSTHDNLGRKPTKITSRKTSILVKVWCTV